MVVHFTFSNTFMKKYLVLYFANTEAVEFMKAMSPEDRKASMEPWFAWKKDNESATVDFGGPVGLTHKLTTQGESTPEHRVMGYSMFQAQDDAALNAVLASNPHLLFHPGNSVEYSEIVAM